MDTESLRTVLMVQFVCNAIPNMCHGEINMPLMANRYTVREANFEQEGNFASSNKVLLISLS